MRDVLNTPRAIREAVRAAIPTWEQESMWVVPLDARGRGVPIMVALGTADSVHVYPRDVFREAIRANATGIVLSHNHPSGEGSPSAQDRVLTSRLQAAGDLLGIPILDHVIVTEGGAYYSFAENGDL